MGGSVTTLLADEATMAADAVEGAPLSFGEWVENLPFNLVYVLIVIVIATILERAVHLLLKHWLKNSSISRSTYIPTIASFIVWLLAASYIIPAIFNVNITTIIAALGVGSVCASVGLQDTITNVVAGFSILYHEVYRVGDNLEVDGRRGEVVDITWRETVLRDSLNNLVIIPNGLVNGSVFFRREGKSAHGYELPIDIRPGLELDKVQSDMIATAREALVEIDALYEDYSPDVDFVSTYAFGVRTIVTLYIRDRTQAASATNAVVCALSRTGYLADPLSTPSSVPLTAGEEVIRL